MTQTLRRELRQKFEEVLSRFADKLSLPEREPLAESLADAALEVRGIAMADKPTARIDRTPEEQALLDEQKMADIIGAAQQGGKTDQALIMFEKAFGFGKLPWDTTATWEKFAKFVVKLYQTDPLAFGNYIVWREDPNGGKYKGYSNKKIRDNPQSFMDTGWPEFENCQTTETNFTKTPPKDGKGFYA